MDALEEERFTWGSHGGDRKPQKIGLGKPAIVWLNKPMSQTEPFTMKVIGRQGQAKVDVVAIDGMQRMANVLRAGKGMTPRGVFRFKSFEEADEWLLEMKTRRKKSRAAGVDLLGEDPQKILDAFKNSHAWSAEWCHTRNGSHRFVAVYCGQTF